MPRRRPRRWDSHDEADPVAGLINLFDIWMVFAAAVLLVTIGAGRPQAVDSTSGQPVPEDAREARPIDRYRLSNEALTGSGEKLGIAYRLASGEIVCVPDAAEGAVASPPSSKARP